MFNLTYSKMGVNRIIDLNNMPVPIKKYIIIIQAIFIIIIITQIGGLILEEVKKKEDKQSDKLGFVILLLVFNMFIFMLFCKKSILTILMTIVCIIYVGTYSFVFCNFKKMQKSYYMFLVIFIIIGLLEMAIAFVL